MVDPGCLPENRAEVVTMPASRPTSIMLLDQFTVIFHSGKQKISQTNILHFAIFDKKHLFSANFLNQNF